MLKERCQSKQPFQMLNDLRGRCGTPAVSFVQSSKGSCERSFVLIIHVHTWLYIYQSVTMIHPQWELKVKLIINRSRTTNTLLVPAYADMLIMSLDITYCLHDAPVVNWTHLQNRWSWFSPYRRQL